MTLPIPKYSYEDLRRKAAAFLREHHPAKSIPIPIEQIVEFHFGINIIPIPGLQRVHDVDAFLSNDLKSIMVDMSMMESRSPNRYRFSLAHELGHAVLHQEVYTQIKFSSIEEWKTQITAISDADREWLEWQAPSFAGLILVPGEPLSEQLQKGLQWAAEQGFSVEEAPELAKGYISSWLGKFFEVSSQVIEKRLDKDRLWPPSSI